MKALALVGVLGALAFVAVGCGSAGGGRSLAIAVSPRIAYRANLWGVGARFISAHRLAFIASGSSSCPPAPYQLIVQDVHRIRINLKTGNWQRLCPLSRVPEPVAVAVDPTQIDVHHRLKINLYYDPTGDYSGPPRPVVLTALPL